jgi:hypothetical protein
LSSVTFALALEIALVLTDATTTAAVAAKVAGMVLVPVLSFRTCLRTGRAFSSSVSDGSPIILGSAFTNQLLFVF